MIQKAIYFGESLPFEGRSAVKKLPIPARVAVIATLSALGWGSIFLMGMIIL